MEKNFMDWPLGHSTIKGHSDKELSTKDKEKKTPVGKETIHEFRWSCFIWDWVQEQSDRFSSA